MLPIRICAQCEQQLTETSYAMRRHAARMTEAIRLARDYKARAEEKRQEFTAMLVASFNEAQSAWDAYRQHLINHGLLPHRDCS